MKKKSENVNLCKCLIQNIEYFLHFLINFINKNLENENILKQMLPN